MPTPSPAITSAAHTPPRDAERAEALRAEVERLTQARDALREAIGAARAEADALPLEERTIARALATALTDLVSLHEPDGTLVYCSPSVERKLGWKPEEIAGLRLDQLLHPDDLERGRAVTAPDGGGEALEELRVRRRDGGYTWLETRSSAADIAGHRYRLYVSREVAERKAAELALHEREAWTRELIDRSALGIYRASADGRFLDVNPALVEMLGYDSNDELLALSIPEHLYADASEREDMLAQAAAQTPSAEVRWRRRDGTPILVRISARLLHDADGRVTGCEGIVEDVTERSRREGLLHRSERMASLGRMVAGVAHELNNPLAAISGFAQLLRRSVTSEEDRGAVETIEREAQRAARVVGDLLDFARHDGVVRLAPVEVGEVLGYVARTQRYTMETRGVRLAVESPSSPLWVEADRGQLEQVLVNLLVNARQACEEELERRQPESDEPAPASAPASPGPLVRLSAHLRDGSVALEVADTGCGISPEALGRIWDPFWTTKPDGEGVGLGLPVVHAAISSLGGQIDVASEVGRGSRFRITLPAVSPPHEPAGEASGEPVPLDVMLVGAAPLVPRFAERFLGERGHAVVCVPSVEAAARALTQGAFDLVILNVPAAQATAAVDAVRQLLDAGSPNGGPRVVVAARRLTRAVREALALPRVTILEHPGDVDELRRAVEG